MKRFLILPVFILAGILMSKVVFAAPAVWQIAINPATKQCAGYWSGDEFRQFKLPTGWKAYYPDFGKGSVVTTEYGSCTFVYLHPEQCCKELGLVFVSDNIGISGVTARDVKKSIVSPLGASVLIIVVVIGFFAIRYFLQKRSRA